MRTLVSLDREAPDATVAVDYVLTVTDAGSPLALTSSAALRLSVADVDDNVPVFAEPTYQFTVCIRGVHRDGDGRNPAKSAVFPRVWV